MMGASARAQAAEECAKSSTVKATEKRSLDEKPYGIKDEMVSNSGSYRLCC